MLKEGSFHATHSRSVARVLVLWNKKLLWPIELQEKLIEDVPTEVANKVAQATGTSFLTSIA